MSNAGDPAGEAASPSGRAPRLPRWTRQEILVLIKGKHMVEGRAGSGGRDREAAPAAALESKWAEVAEYCRRNGVERGAVQCRKLWSNLAGGYKKVKEWERTAAAAREPSFWAMGNGARRERHLPGFFDSVVYDTLEGRGRAILKGRSARDATKKEAEEEVVPVEEVEEELVIGTGHPATEEALFPEEEVDSGRPCTEEALFSEKEEEEEVAPSPAPLPPVIALPIADSSTHKEALNCASLGVVGSLLRKLNELLSIEDQARQPIRDLGSIRIMLEKLSDIHNPPHMVSFWMKAARELSYDMVDFVDQFDNASGADAEKDSFNQLISIFKARMEELMERYIWYSPEYVRSQTTDTLASHRVPVAHGREPHPAVFIGVDCPAREILQWLKVKGDDDREKQLKVVSILGVEGIGKSTLAHKLWRDLEGDFECRAFIQTAKKPDIRMILTNVLSQVSTERPLESFFHVPNLIQDIRKHLQDKRYFILIDDLWAVSVWDVLSRAFPDCNCSSRILITTTIENIALSCSCYDPGYLFRMKPLSEDHSKKIFNSTAFGPGNGCPPQVNDNVDEITRKCGGLPLALICLASVVARLPEIGQQLKYLKFVCNNLHSNSTAMEVLNQVLNLCCNSLPHSLKTCLLYLSVYPMSYIILKEDLVKQWIAEGFICALDGSDIEEVARSYFDELVNLNLIQRLDISNSDRKRVSYQMHPVVHYFITRNSIKDNFITVIDYTQSTVVFIDKIRRLALHFGTATYATTPASAGLSQVRSFAFMGLMSCMPSLMEFELVRVIIIHLKDDHGGTPLCLTEIRKLFLLRYLQVRCNVTVILPDQLQCLKHLETLEINAVVSAIPSGIVNHPILKHVHLGRKMKHRNVILGPDTLDEADFLNNSGTISSASLQILELVPYSSRICSFSWLPAWVQQLRGLHILEIVVRELRKYDIEYLSDLPFLSSLSLYVRKPTAKCTITFRRGVFTALKFLKLVSGVLVLSFEDKAAHNLEKLKIGFNTHKGQDINHMVEGIHHLLNLQLIVASIGTAHEYDRIAVESALRYNISMHPCHPRFKVRRVEPFDEECNPLNIRSQEAGSSNEQISFPTVQNFRTKKKRTTFVFKLLEDITNNFSETHKVGSGHFGEFYTGVLHTGVKIIVKKLYQIQDLDDEIFEKDIYNHMMVRHENIVSLECYCCAIRQNPNEMNGTHMPTGIKERALCFEHLMGGSLDKHLSDESCGFDWHIRFKIIKGVCVGLNYIHNKCKDHIYCLDLKTANILLDENWMPKIADFGLSKLLKSTLYNNAEKNTGTIRYMPPEYIENGLVSDKFDVFSLGVIIIEIMAGPLGYSKCHEMPPQLFAELVHGNWKKRFYKMSWHTSYEPESLEVRMCIEMALRCVDADHTKRPTVAEIINELNDFVKENPAQGKPKKKKSRGQMEYLRRPYVEEIEVDGIGSCSGDRFEARFGDYSERNGDCSVWIVRNRCLRYGIREDFYSTLSFKDLFPDVLEETK